MQSPRTHYTCNLECKQTWIQESFIHMQRNSHDSNKFILHFSQSPPRKSCNHVDPCRFSTCFAPRCIHMNHASLKSHEPRCAAFTWDRIAIHVNRASLYIQWYWYRYSMVLVLYPRQRRGNRCGPSRVKTDRALQKRTELAARSIAHRVACETRS